jgi:arylsulfatase A-like enzyme
MPPLLIATALALGVVSAGAASRPPNIVLIVADDLGYGDLGCYGHPTIRTPALDRLAAEGQKWTSFYAAASVCTPSRAALLTGRWPVRTGMASDRRLVLTTRAAGGLPPDEVTLAELLAARGYATAAIGKWHLGHLPPFLPTRQGFGSFFGTPYSNDEAPAPAWREAFARRDYWNTPLFFAPRSEYWDIPLLRDETEVERPVDQTNLAERYAVEAERFITVNAAHPFFLYFAPNMPHVPLFASPAFQGRSPRGPYGDAVEELDATVGRIVAALRREGLERDTLLVFTSDNGPWLVFGDHGGSAGLLRDGKGSTWEGGQRVPAIVWGPGRVAPGVVTGLGAGIDLFPSFAAAAGAELPAGLELDGLDLGPVWRGAGPSPRETMLYYRGTVLQAVRQGPFKAHFATRPGFGVGVEVVAHEPPLLFQVEHDPGEQRDVAARHPEILQALRRLAEETRSRLMPVADHLAPQLPAPGR